MNVVRRALFVLLTLAMVLPAAAEPLPFRRAVELALRHSATMAIAAADQVRAHEAYLELRNMYLPQVTVGSGLGFSYGYPMSIEGAAPSIISVDTRQYLLNFSHREFMRAARVEWEATSAMSADKRSQVILETSAAYVELDKVTTALRVLAQEQEAAQRAEQIVADRVREGVDSEVALTRARLVSARTRLRIAEAQGAADVLRLRLAQLTGLPAADIETVTESVPRLPLVSQEDDLSARALLASPVVKIADQQALAKGLRAKGAKKALYPQIDLAGSYGLFSRHNNYDEFFLKFQRNNASFGMAMRLPLFNFAGKAQARAAEAEATRARKQAETVKDQVAAETLRLQRAVRQLAAAREVARLEHDLARSDVEAVQARMEAGTASLREQEQARQAEAERYSRFLDADFALAKAQLELMKLTGDLEGWALR